jgi:hypothetical protein
LFPEVGVITTNYHKGGLLYGTEKINMKVMPYAVTYLLRLLLSVIRPVEECLVLRFLVTEENRAQVLDNYASYLFLSFGHPTSANDLGQALKSWFRQRLNVNVGIRLYRHISILFERLESREEDRIKMGEDAKGTGGILARAAEIGTGHSQKVGELNYSRTKEDGAVLWSDRLAAFKVAQRLHKQLGLATTEDDLTSVDTAIPTSSTMATPARPNGTIVLNKKPKIQAPKGFGRAGRSKKEQHLDPIKELPQAAL